MFPAESTATHSVVEGQAIALRPLPELIVAADQPDCPMPGAVEVRRLPLASTA